MSIQRQFTASVYILREEHVLLLFHQKLKKWLPAGGHVDANETCQEAAIREAKEETGFNIELCSFQKSLDIEEKNAISLPSPFLCLLEEIPSYKEIPYHQHVDFIFIGKIISGELKENPRESQGLKWFSLKDIDKLNDHLDFFKETLTVLKYLRSISL